MILLQFLLVITTKVNNITNVDMLRKLITNKYSQNVKKTASYADDKNKSIQCC